ncbi:hypothetical protein THIOKS11960010 [Thiocapsa sp. KS1]|nr:hypothetical protein THIOKS11960010 [Thiocapsa sp. KS1]
MPWVDRYRVNTQEPRTPEAKLVLVLAIGHVQTAADDVNVLERRHRPHQARQDDMGIGFFPTPSTSASSIGRRAEERRDAAFEPQRIVLRPVRPSEAFQECPVGCGEIRATTHAPGEKVDTGLKLGVRAVQDSDAFKQQREPKIVQRFVEIAADKEACTHQELGDQARSAPADPSDGHRPSNIDVRHHKFAETICGGSIFLPSRVSRRRSTAADKLIVQYVCPDTDLKCFRPFHRAEVHTLG